MRWLPIAIVFFCLGCPPVPTPLYGFDAGGTDCASNSAPFLGGVEMNSRPTSAGTYLLSLSLTWRDPGLSGAEDGQNMRGGYLSGEIVGHSFPSQWIAPEHLDTGCIDPEAAPGACLDSGHGAGDEAGDVETPDGHRGCGDSSDPVGCQQGELTFFLENEDGFEQYTSLSLEFRIRDRCGGTGVFEDLCNPDSTVRQISKVVNYEIGSGLRTDGCGEGT